MDDKILLAYANAIKSHCKDTNCKICMFDRHDRVRCCLYNEIPSKWELPELKKQPKEPITREELKEIITGVLKETGLLKQNKTETIMRYGIGE